MQNSSHLSTEAYGGAWDDRINRSVPGMAHFALTGPASTVCRQCKHWGRSDAFKRDGDHRLRRRTCQKFLRMCAADSGPAIDPETPSCRHFDERKVAPDLVRLPRPKSKKVKSEAGLTK